jgi:sugar O-acyltransferase (sialic acid O-acetyltransferase NeuD family)
MKKLIIVGMSAFAEIAKEYFDEEGIYEVIAFSVEKEFIKDQVFNGIPVIPFEELDKKFSAIDHYVFVAITYLNMNRTRARLVSAAKRKGFKLASYVSPDASISSSVQIGEHCFIFEKNIIQPFVRIEDNTILWSGNHVGHHSIIHRNCFISSHVVISGFCEIAENCFLGVNSTISNNVKVASDNWLGPNTLILKNTNVGDLFKSEPTKPSKVSSFKFFRIRAPK